MHRLQNVECQNQSYCRPRPSYSIASGFGTVFTFPISDFQVMTQQVLSNATASSHNLPYDETIERSTLSSNNFVFF